MGKWAIGWTCAGKMGNVWKISEREDSKPYKETYQGSSLWVVGSLLLLKLEGFKWQRDMEGHLPE